MRRLLIFLLNLGVAGPLLLGILDSSFLFLPFGNDLLLTILVARNHQRFFVYVLVASIGSAIGVLLLDAVCRKGGEEGLSRMFSHKRFTYFKKKMSEHAAGALVVACLAPPPFPFTAVIAAASAFQYPKPRLLAIVVAARVVRFSLVGLAAVFLGRQILRMTQTTEFLWFMGGFISLCVVGSIISIVRWMRLSRSN